MLEGKTCQESAVILKNRAACYLKLGFYKPSFWIYDNNFMAFLDFLQWKILLKIN